MKKTKMLFASVIATAMMLTACNFGPSSDNSNSNNGNFRQQDIYQLYKAAGGEMSYEEWLESIRGADGSTFRAGTSDPADTDGNNGDIYVNTTTWDVFLKIGGSWASLGNIRGAKGEDGKDGKDGVDGKDGKDGVDGKDGKDGVDGKDGKDGVDGKDGADGAPGRDGIDGAPGRDGVDGKDGKDGRDGVDGKDGASILYGYGRPADSNGKDGDCYIDLSNFDFYAKENGHWNKLANMKEDLKWDIVTEANMMKYLGETLPFADFDTSTIVSGYSAYYESMGIGMFYVWDYADFYSLEDYGDKLLAAGFERDNYYTSPSTEAYIKECARGYDIEVVFGFDDGNCINVYMPPYVPPYSAEFFLENNFVAVEGWPAENVSTTMGDYEFDGVNLDGTFYERFKLVDAGDKGTYYSEIIATEGSFADDLADQAIAAGLTQDEDDEYAFFDEAGYEMYLEEKDGFTVAYFYSAYIAPADYDEAYFIENGYTKVEGYPAELMNLTFGDDLFEGVNNDGDWFVKYTKNDSSLEDKYYISSYLATAGDYTEAFAQQLIDAGFTTSNGSYYTKQFATDSGSVTLEFKRGYTTIRIVGPWVYPNGLPPQPDRFTPAEVRAAMVAYFADNNIDIDIPDYPANENAYFEEYAYADPDELGYKLYNSNRDEAEDYADMLDEAGWNVSVDSWGDIYCSAGDSGANISMEIYSSAIYVTAYVEFPPESLSASEASAAIVSFFADCDVDVEVVDYATASDDAYFAINESAALLDRFEIDVFGSSYEEMLDFIADSEELGWVATFDNYGDASMLFGDTGAQMDVEDWIDYSYGCIRIICSYTEPVVVLDEFPLADVNSFLTTYGLGFQLTAGLPDASGNGFQMQSLEDSGYHGLAVMASGDQTEAWDAIIGPIVEAAGYYYDALDWEAYINDDEHIVRIGYDEDYNYTFVTFWE